MAKKKTAQKTGRPSRYNATVPRFAKFMARTGLTDAEMAEKIGIACSTFYKWKKDHKELANALIQGKEEPDDMAEASLFSRVTGYDYVEEIETVVGNDEEGFPILAVTKRIHKHLPPETLAIQTWLNNRRPERWRQRQEIHNTYDDSAIALAEAISKI